MYGDCFDTHVRDCNAYGFVYCTTNMVNGRKYIGQHKVGQPNDNRYLGSGLFFKQAIEKYGRQNFAREILGYANSKEELDQLEIDMISKYNAVDSDEFYNIAPGAYSHNQTQETRDKIRNTLTGIKRSDETRAKMSECKKRENLSEETRRKLSEAATRRTYSPEEKQRLRANLDKYRQSEEYQQKQEMIKQKRLRKDEAKRIQSMNAKNKPIKVRCIETGKVYNNLHEADQDMDGVDYRSLSAHIHGRIKQVNGYHFERVE